MSYRPARNSALLLFILYRIISTGNTRRAVLHIGHYNVQSGGGGGGGCTSCGEAIRLVRGGCNSCLLNYITAYIILARALFAAATCSAQCNSGWFYYVATCAAHKVAAQFIFARLLKSTYYNFLLTFTNTRHFIRT